MLGMLDFRRTAASGFAPMVRKVAAILACVPMALSAAPPMQPKAMETLPQATNLALDAATMREKRMPMLVLYNGVDSVAYSRRIDGYRPWRGAKPRLWGVRVVK